jgi:hypothetical protein
MARNVYPLRSVNQARVVMDWRGLFRTQAGEVWYSHGANAAWDPLRRRLILRASEEVWRPSKRKKFPA